MLYILKSQKWKNIFGSKFISLDMFKKALKGIYFADGSDINRNEVLPNESSKRTIVVLQPYTIRNLYDVSEMEDLFEKLCEVNELTPIHIQEIILDWIFLSIIDSENDRVTLGESNYRVVNVTDNNFITHVANNWHIYVDSDIPISEVIYIKTNNSSVNIEFFVKNKTKEIVPFVKYNDIDGLFRFNNLSLTFGYEIMVIVDKTTDLSYFISPIKWPFSLIVVDSKISNYCTEFIDEIDRLPTRCYKDGNNTFDGKSINVKHKDLPYMYVTNSKNNTICYSVKLFDQFKILINEISKDTYLLETNYKIKKVNKAFYFLTN